MGRLPGLLSGLPTVFYIGLALINLLAFLIMGLDKRRARRGARRIPERTLFLAVFLGGGLGGILGLRLFRHKTLHRRFTLGFPLIFLLELGLFLFLICRVG